MQNPQYPPFSGGVTSIGAVQNRVGGGHAVAKSTRQNHEH
jgi:hypothetical protein